MMQAFLYLIPYCLVTLFVLVVDILNSRYVSPDIQRVFDIYEVKDTYAKSQQYLRDKTNLSMSQSLYMLVATLVFIFIGGIDLLDLWVRGFGASEVLTGVIYLGCIIIGITVLTLPFSIYSTFVVEKNYNFNNMTPLLFIVDTLKSLLLTILIGGPVLAAVLWFFMTFDQLAWLMTLLFMMGFQAMMMVIAPLVIMPLFNKFEPIDDPELEQKIMAYANAQNFAMQGVFKMDGSKRSTKANAYFTGFGSARRIVLFDTLLANHSQDEIISILAHEMGHYKKKHIQKMLAVSMITLGVTLGLFQVVTHLPQVYAAFGVTTPSVYVGMLLFGFLYSPLSVLFSVLANYQSRVYEFEADAYAAKTTGNAMTMVLALKKLSVDHLSNITPHPLKVWLEYSHPTVLKRIDALEAIE